MACIPSRTAGRYGRALMLEAAEEGVIDSVGCDLDAVRASLDRSPELRRFMTSRLVPAPVRRRTLAALFSELHPLTLRFIFFLDSRRRAGLLGPVCAAFRTLRDQRAGVLRMRVATAFPIRPDEEAKVAARLGSRWPGRLLIELETCPLLLGGLRIRVGDRVEDLSLSAQLRMMKQRLLAMPAAGTVTP